jgi:hypothetical protein
MVIGRDFTFLETRDMLPDGSWVPRFPLLHFLT